MDDDIVEAVPILAALPSDCETCIPSSDSKRAEEIPTTLLSLIGFWPKWHLESVTLSDSCRIHVCTQEITSLPYTWIPEWI